MKPSVEPVKVTILDKEYLIACPEDEREGLLRSASILNRRMREIRESGKVVGADRIAVMAALNLAHELLRSEDAGNALADSLEQRLTNMHRRLDTALPGGH
ncbi:MAG: cell division protein ZapA [Ectothiorhodospiraceae bacterium]|nr:cell division protein ZapA [Ectothiorhodospiraceae bacterium]